MVEELLVGLAVLLKVLPAAGDVGTGMEDDGPVVEDVAGVALFDDTHDPAHKLNEGREVGEDAEDRRDGERFDVRSQTAIQLEEIPLIAEDPDALAALRVLQERGYTSDQVRQAYDKLEPVPVTRVRQRQAMRGGLDMRVRTKVGHILKERGVNSEGHGLDRQRLGQTNFVVLKSAIDRQVNAAVDRQSRSRHEFTQPELDRIKQDFDGIVERAVQEVFGAAN